MNLRTWTFRGSGLVKVPAALILASGLASASAILGDFGFSGPGVLVFNSLGAGYIEFCSQADPNCSSAPTATGDLAASGAGTGSFSGLTSADTGTLDNITDTSPPLAPFTYFPVGIPASIDDYLVLSAFPAWDFQADLLEAATCTASATQQCLGPFQLDQNGPNVSVTMVVLGMLINTADGSTSNLDITFTGQYNSTTIAAVESAGMTTAGVFSDSWSATADAMAPEPGTASMMLLAGGVLTLLSRIRRRRG
jgi:hypothetical protein